MTGCVVVALVAVLGLTACGREAAARWHTVTFPEASIAVRWPPAASVTGSSYPIEVRDAAGGWRHLMTGHQRQHMDAAAVVDGELVLTSTLGGRARTTTRFPITDGVVGRR